jgi:SAM-dependent methyltransferase
MDDRPGADEPRLDAHLELAALSDEEFVRRAYRTVLRRDPEPEAIYRAVPRAALLRDLVGSAEFARLLALDEAIARSDERFLEAPAGADERLIEIPWALARIGGADRILDLGTANADPAYVAALVRLGARDLVGADLATAEIPGVQTVVADARDLPFPDASFDLVLCVSTLEHVGRDNRVYGVEEPRDEHGAAAALRELHRVLDRHGRLVLTVPTGEPEDHGWFVQLDPAGWNELFVESGFRVADEELYVRRPDGWRAGSDVSGLRYGEGAAALLCAELRPRPRWRETFRRFRAPGRPSGAAPPAVPPPRPPAAPPAG